MAYSSRSPADLRHDIRLIDLVLRVAAAVMAFVAGTWLSLGKIVAEKVLTQLAMPAGILWLLLLVAILASRRAGRADLMLAIAVPWTLLTLLGNSLLTGMLAYNMEAPFRQIRPLQSEPLTAIVLLGGGTSTGGNRRVQGNTAGDRVLLAAQLYHAGVTPRVICTGRRITELAPHGTDPATESREMLMSLGVPENAIEMLEGRNTSEEMTLLGRMFQDQPQSVGLVTSAWHLPRALRLAQKNGFQPAPLPADFISRPEGRLTTGGLILGCIPSDGALWTTSKLMKEQLGMLVGR